MIGSTYPVQFSCDGDCLQAMLHAPAEPRRTGVLVVVGGPQYRVGSHRQFVLLGRALAAHAISVLRFDYRGLGDSGGTPRTFEDVQADMRAAVDEFLRRVPTLERVVIWGLCDAASAATFYAAGDKRIAGLVLLNPWARSDQTVARAYLKHYYLRRLFDPRAWRDLLTGRKSPFTALRSVGDTVRDAVAQDTGNGQAQRAPLTDRMRGGLEAFKGPVLLILSGDDITAAEFRDVAESSRAWRTLVGATRVTRCELAAADHTFSTRAWRDQVAQWTADWVEKHFP
jgi:uncharacterized protein